MGGLTRLESSPATAGAGFNLLPWRMPLHADANAPRIMPIAAWPRKRHPVASKSQGEAKKWLEKAISGAPAAFNMYVRNRVPWFRPEDYAHLVEGLRKAGWGG